MMNNWSHITKPTLVISKKRAVNNILQMAQKIKSQNIIFRPHFKTHQSLEVGLWFRELGISKISVSSVDMAQQFVQAAWNDISIVFPFNRREIENLNTFSSLAHINILLEDIDTAQYISENSTAELGVFIKIDCSYQRSGISATDFDAVKSLATEVHSLPNLKLKGLLSHFGNTYAARGEKEVQDIYSNSKQLLINLRHYLKADFPDLMISIGDTPSASLVDDFGEIDEMRPGNFVFYDWMQYQIGSCSLNQIATIVLCPVVAKHPQRNEIVIHGGAVHFSKEKLAHYGAICSISKEFNTNIIDGVYLKSISQEHGIVQCTDDFIEQINIGDLIGVIPIHSCLTANLMKENTQIN